MNYTTYSAFNVLGGVNYVNANGSLTWADAEVGIKCMNVVVNSMPTGPGIIGVNLTGNAYRNRVYILLNNGSVYPNAVYAASYNNGGSDSSAQTGGAGTVASPFLNPSHALSTMAGGGLLYMRGGNYRNWRRYGGENFSGINIPSGSRTSQTPLIVMPYPGETVTVDQNYFGGGGSDGNGYDNTSGFVFRGGATNTFILGPITVQRSTGAGVDDVGGSSDIVIYRLTIQDLLYNQVTQAGIHIQASQNWLIQDTVFRRIYQTQGGTSNPYITSTAASLANGVQIFGAQNYSLIKNTFDVVANALEVKGAPQTDTNNNTFDVSHNLFLRVQSAPIIYLGYQYGGATGGTSRSLIRYNVADNPSYAVAPTQGFVQSWTQSGSGAPQATGLQIYNNVLRNLNGGSNGIIQIAGIQDVWIMNNIFENSQTPQIEVQNLSSRINRIMFSDFNNYYNGSKQWVLPGATYSSLTAWRSVVAGTYLARSNPDARAVEVSPAYIGAGSPGFDYRITSGALSTAGRFGRPIGVGNETVGALSAD